MNDVARCCDEYDEYRRWTLSQTRRDFLKTAVGAMAIGGVAPNLFIHSALADRMRVTDDGGPILVVIQLQGGNDGLNTIVPYGSSLYYQDRPNIAVPADKVIPIDGTVGFNPNLQSLKSMFDSGRVAVLQGVGYPNPDLSHFRSTQIWETGDPAGNTQTGWLGRYLDAAISRTDNPFTAVAVGATVPMTLLSTRVPVTSVESVSAFRFMLNRGNANLILKSYREMYEGVKDKVPPYVGLVRQAGANAEQGVQELQGISTKYTSTVKYPDNPLARDLQLVAQMISTGLGTRIFHVTLGGFDDHAAEVFTHAKLLEIFDDSVSAFYQDLEAQSKADRVLTMTFSEFGRRVRENAGRGTDHGTAAPLFVIGTKIKGGMYGTDPVLGTLDSDANLIYGMDFRSVYGTVLDGWLGTNPTGILNGSFERLPFL